MTTTPPPSSSSSPSEEAASLSSFLSAISATSTLPKSSKNLFSPTQTVESAVTNGTGATGSTEIEGTATKSLVESVEGRREGSWIKLEEPEDRFEEFQVTEKEFEEELKGLRGEEKRRFRFPQGEIEEDETTEIEEEQGLQEEKDRSFLEQQEEQEEEEEEKSLSRVTASQEREGLERSVTRSQSDFTRWLEDTMRLARGDGSSVIETDDALSSIIQATRETRFGHSLSSNSIVSDENELLQTPIHLVESLPVEDLSFEHVEEVQEDEIKEKQTPVLEEKHEFKENEKASEQEEEEKSTLIARPSRNYGWKFLSLSLSLALVYSIHRQRSLTLSIKPTRSTRFVPTFPDNSTTLYSPFATPVPVAPSFTLPIYAILFTLLTAVPTSIHLLRRRSVPDVQKEEERTRAVSPLLDLNGDDLLKARQLVELGTKQFDSRQYLLSISTFERVLPLACPVGDKALSSEYLGKSHFQLARHSSNDRTHLEQSKKHFERCIRLDKTRASPRVGLGITKYWLGDYEGAVKVLETAIKRDETCSTAYEYLAKSLYRKEGSILSCSIQSHLERAMELDSKSYSTLSFYGEILHLSGGGGKGRQHTLLAKRHLERSLELRIDQPQVHARLAFIANELLDPILASNHFRSALKYREKGRKDESCPGSLEAIQGITPYLSLYFVLPPSLTSERIKVLQHALKFYPHDELVSLLLSIHTSSVELSTRSTQLEVRSLRYPQDSFVKGLWALSLLAIGEQEEAERVYQEFWKGVGGRKGEGEGEGEGEDKRRVAWLVMGFYEIKGMKQQERTIKSVNESSKEEKEKGKIVKVKVESRETTPVRRSTRIIKRA